MSDEQQPVQNSERKINVLQLTFVHDVGRGTIAGTATTPYLEDPTDSVIVALRNHLVEEFARVTAPTKPGETSPVWGEHTQFPDGPKDQAEIRVPAPKTLLTLVAP